MDALGPNELLGIEDVARLFRSGGFRWWIAGGWGIDLFLDEETRPHEDVDVLILRRDQEKLRELLATWDLHVADPPRSGSLRPWMPGEWLELPIHELWCRPAPDAPWQIEVVLGESHQEDWVYRRQPSVTRPISEMGASTAGEVSYVVPEILLLFKAKPLRPKDQQDFDVTVDRLTAGARRWLGDALSAAHPGHPWIERLRGV